MSFSASSSSISRLFLRSESSLSMSKLRSRGDIISEVLRSGTVARTVAGVAFSFSVAVVGGGEPAGDGCDSRFVSPMTESTLLEDGVSKVGMLDSG